MKVVKNVFMIGLLMISSNIFCDLDKSMNQATTDLYFTTIAAVRSALMIGASSYVVDNILSRFESTQDMENRGAMASSACVAVYLLFLVSAEWQEFGSQAVIEKRGYYKPIDEERVKTFEEKLLDSANAWALYVVEFLYRMTGNKENFTDSVKK